MMKTILITMASSLVFAILGLLFGAWYGGNYGFFPFLGLRGYEAGGLFCAIVGLMLGGLLAFFLIYKK